LIHALKSLGLPATGLLLVHVIGSSGFLVAKPQNKGFRAV